MEVFPIPEDMDAMTIADLVGIIECRHYNNTIATRILLIMVTVAMQVTV